MVLPRVHQRTARTTVLVMLLVTGAAALFLSSQRSYHQDARERALDRRESRIIEREHVLDHFVISPAAGPILISAGEPTPTTAATLLPRPTPSTATSTVPSTPTVPPVPTTPTTPTTTPMLCTLPPPVTPLGGCNLITSNKTPSAAAALPVAVPSAAAFLGAIAISLKRAKESSS